jgi:hypothetical protein
LCQQVRNITGGAVGRLVKGLGGGDGGRSAAAARGYLQCFKGPPRAGKPDSSGRCGDEHAGRISDRALRTAGEADTCEAQAIARVYRMGQVRSVQVHRLLVANSVDQRMLEILDSKSRLSMSTPVAAPSLTAARRRSISPRPHSQGLRWSRSPRHRVAVLDVIRRLQSHPRTRSLTHPTTKPHRYNPSRLRCAPPGCFACPLTTLFRTSFLGPFRGRRGAGKMGSGSPECMPFPP